MNTISANFKFKGDRNYIHGPDIYNMMMEHTTAGLNPSKIERVKLTIHAFASHQCQLLVGRPSEPFNKPDHLIADLTLVTPEGNVTSALVETGQSISDTYSFDERKIEALCEISGQSITINGDSEYSSVEVAVSMTKQLHNRLFPRKDGKWIVTGYDLRRPLAPKDSANLTVHFQHNFNDRLTKSELLFRGKSIGNIFFSLVSQ